MDDSLANNKPLDQKAQDWTWIDDCPARFRMGYVKNKNLQAAAQYDSINVQWVGRRKCGREKEYE